MAGTVITKEIVEDGTDAARLEREIELRIKAGAIRARVEEQDGQTILITEWNVIGENAQ